MTGIRRERRATHHEVVLDRPPVNALTMAAFADLGVAFAACSADPVPVLVRSSSSRFCAGFDLGEVVDAAVADAAALGCLDRVASHPAPVIAAVEGAAVGVGLLLAMCADLLVVHPDTRLGMPEAKLGRCPDGRLLGRYLADAWARRLCLTGDLCTATELGLDRFGAIVTDDVVGTGRELAASLGGLDPSVSAAVKAQWPRLSLVAAAP